MQRSQFLASAALAATLAISVPSAAVAAVSAEVNPNCFGKGASQIARGEFIDSWGNPIDVGMGVHASSQDSPRIGIGNLAGAPGFDDFVHQSEVADYLGADCS